MTPDHDHFYFYKEVRVRVSGQGQIKYSPVVLKQQIKYHFIMEVLIL